MLQVRPVFYRKWLERALLLAVFAGALLSVAAWAVNTTQIRNYLRDQAEKAFYRELGLRLQIRDFDLELYRLAVVARDIRIDHPKYGRVADAELLRISPSFFALTQGKVDLQSIGIERASLRLLIRDKKVINLPQVPAASSEDKSIDLPFERLVISESRVEVDADEYGSGEISQLNVRVVLTHDDLVRVRIEASDGIFEHKKGRDLIEKLRLVGQVTADNVQLELFELQTPTSRLAIRHAGLSLPAAERYHGDVQLELDLEQIAKWPHDLTLPALSGKLSLQAAVVNDENGPSGGGQITITNGKIKNRYELGEVFNLEFEATKERVEYKGGIELAHDGGVIEVDGTLGLTEALDLDVDAEVADVRFAILMKHLGVSPDAIVDWTLAGSFRLAGTLSPLDLSGPLHFQTRDFKVTRDAWHQKSARHIIAVHSARLDGSAGVRPDGIHLEQMRVKFPSSTLFADVLLGFDDALWVRGGSNAFDLDDCTPLLKFELAGKGGFGVEIDGTFSDPIVSGKLQFQDFAFSTYPFGDVKSDFRLEKDSQAVRFPLITARKRESGYSARDLFLDFTNHRFAASADLKIDRLTLQDFYHVFHYEDDERYKDYKGEVKGSSQISYTLDFPGDSPAGTMVADIDLEIPECQIDAFAYRDGRFKGQWKWLDHRKGYRGGQLAVEYFSLQKGEGTISISGAMGLDGKLDMVVVADRVALRETEGFNTHISALGGSYALTGTVKGTVASPRADFDLSVTGLGFKGKSLGDGRFYVRLTDKQDPWVKAALSWKPGSLPTDEPCARARYGFAHGYWPEDPPLRTSDGPVAALDQPMAYLVCGGALAGQVGIDLAVGRTKAYPLRGRITLDQFQLGPLIPQTREEKPLQGALSGQVDFDDGALLTPYNLSGRIVLNQFELKRDEVELHSNGDLNVLIRAGGFKIENADFSAASSNLRVRGGGSWIRGLDLDVDGSVDLGLLSSLFQTVSQAKGKVRLQFNVTGPFASPAVYGQASVRDAALRFASFPEPIESLNGNVTFNAHRVLLDSFRARTAGGLLRLQGSAELQGRGLGGYNLEIEARDLMVQQRGEHDIEAKFAGRAQLVWERGKGLPKLMGTVRIDHLLYRKNIDVAPMLSDVYRPNRVSVEPYDPGLDRITLDLRVKDAKPLRIENNLMDAELEIQEDGQPFRITGTDQRFGITGNLKFKRGVLRFRDTDFEIRQGDITFADPRRIDPQFNLVAVTDLRRTSDSAATSWHIKLTAKGNSESFKLKATSDPYLAEEDIALLLAIGMTRAEIEQSQTGTLTETAALEALASVTGVNREVRRAVPGFDEFRLKSAYSESTGRTEPQVSIGKRIADRVRLNASSGLAQSRDINTGVEFQLNDQTSLEAVYNNQHSNTGTSQVGDLGVDLNWRLEFN
ncbi:MAG: translocation/assembly module TamB domain-containing protein [Deltaproteobacteria bacterium]|nr:translocation/assembly module TamB domain-containing protein [Deltaproteobacteria bacterium]